jgi:hypothetical protein
VYKLNTGFNGTLVFPFAGSGLDGIEGGILVSPQELKINKLITIIKKYDIFSKIYPTIIF